MSAAGNARQLREDNRTLLTIRVAFTSTADASDKLEQRVFLPAFLASYSRLMNASDAPSSSAGAASNAMRAGLQLSRLLPNTTLPVLRPVLDRSSTVVRTSISLRYRTTNVTHIGEVALCTQLSSKDSVARTLTARNLSASVLGAQLGSKEDGLIEERVLFVTKKTRFINFSFRVRSLFFRS